MSNQSTVATQENISISSSLVSQTDKYSYAEPSLARADVQSQTHFQSMTPDIPFAQ